MCSSTEWLNGLSSPTSDSYHPNRNGHKLGYEPLVPFGTGLADTVSWYRENRAWWEPLKSRAALAR